MYSLTNSLLPDLAKFKALGMALIQKGKEAEQRGENAEAVRANMDAIQLGQKIEHGPLISLLVGIAIEKSALDAVEKLAPRLGAEQRKGLGDQIETMNRQRLPFPEIMMREHYFARRITGNPVKLLLARFLSRTSFKKAEQKQERLSSDFERVAKNLRLPPAGM